VDGLAAGAATPRAFVLGQVLLEAGKGGKAAGADRAVDGRVVFVIVAEHGRF